MMPEGAEILFDAAAVGAAYDDIAARLNRDLPDEEILLLPVMTGGIFPACELARRIRRPMRIDYVHATRYRGRTSGSDIQWLHWPELPGHPETIVLVDDIFDEGHTLAAIHDRLAGQFDVVTAVLVRKWHERGLPRDWVDYFGLDIPDRYVFGCGMDYHENFRELPDLWALAEKPPQEGSE